MAFKKGNQFAKGNPPNKTSFKKEHIPWIKGKKMSEEFRNKCSIANKNKHHSLATEFKKGFTPWNKGKMGIMPAPWNKGKKYLQVTGSKNPRWKGGIMKHSNGYILVLKPEHPFANKAGYVFEHRLVIEKQIRRYLTPKETVHHLGERDDNRLKMLMAFINNPAHLRFHKNSDLVKPKEIIFDGKKYS